MITSIQAAILLSLSYERRAFPMGDGLKNFRQELMFQMTGNKIPAAKCGAGAVRDQLAISAGITAWTCLADKEEKIIEWLKTIQ